MLTVQYDPEADALFVRLGQSEGTERGDRLDARRIVAYDRRDQVVGVEFLEVSRGIDLDGVPHAEEITAALTSFPRIEAA